MVQDNEQNAIMCLCPGCPSFNDCMSRQAERLYCARNKSYCEVKSNGCICPTCHVYAENGLFKMYYCISGKA